MKKYFELTMDTKKAHDYFMNMLAYTLGPKDLKHLVEHHLNAFNLFDVRDYDNYLKGHIPYAIHVPYDQLEEQLVKFSKDKINIIYSCSLFCSRGKKCCEKLSALGYPVMELTGGFKGWKKQDYEIIEDDVSDYPG